MSSVDRLEIPKDAILDGSNFTDWKMIVSSVLEQHGLDTIMTKQEAGELPQSDTAQSETAQQMMKARQARTFLLFSMNREHRNKISHCSSAEEIWSTITNMYENKSKRAINTLWKKLFNYRIEAIGQISQGISEMQTLVSSLRARGIKVDDSCLVGCIECALPDDFNDWLINWSMRDTEPTLNELISSINNFVETLKATEAKAFIAKTQQNRSNNPNSLNKTNKSDKILQVL